MYSVIEPAPMKLIEQLTFDDVQIVPEYSEIGSRNEVKTSSQLTRRWRIETPLVASPMDSVCDWHMMQVLMNIGAVGTLHRFFDIDGQVEHLKDFTRWIRANQRQDSNFDYPVVAAIGATGDYQERAVRLVEAGANILLIDVAHGDHVHVRNALHFLNLMSNRSQFDVIAGNIATADAALRLQDWGADALRVGIGGGSMCETRVRTGIGIPQLSAIMEVANVANVPVISDGGIKLPGDVAKAIAAGADTVMIGSLFSGTIEAPGDVFVTGQFPNEKKFKVFRGSASASAKFAIRGAADYVEGTATMVPLKGSVETVVRTIMDGLRSSMSYVGTDNIEDFQLKARFVRITNAGLVEAHPHGLR